MQASTSAHRIARRDPRRNGDDYPMTSLSDGLGPQKDPNSGRTRVESGPSRHSRWTPRRRRPIVKPSEGEADPRLVVTDGGEAQPSESSSPTGERLSHRPRPDAPPDQTTRLSLRATIKPEVMANGVGGAD